MTQNYKAVFLNGPKDISVKTVDFPELKDGEILVKIKAATTCGTDLKNYNRGMHPKMYEKIPTELGHEFSGEVYQISKSQTKFKIGDPVIIANSAPCFECFYCQKKEYNLCENLIFINGGYSEFIKLPAQIVNHNTYLKPENLSFELAALVEPFACVLQAIEKTQIQNESVVAIYGTGPMAFLFEQSLRTQKNCTTILIGRNEHRLNLAKKSGTHYTINNTKANPLTEIKKITNGYGADIAIEAVGNPDLWQETFQLVRKGGKVCLYGGCQKGTSFELDTYRLHYEEITVIGAFHHTPNTIQMAIEQLANQAIESSIFFGKTVNFKTIKEAFENFGKDRPLKYIFYPE